MKLGNLLVFKLSNEWVKSPFVKCASLNLERRNSLAAQLSHVGLAIDHILDVEEQAVDLLRDFRVLYALLVRLHARGRHRLAWWAVKVFHSGASWARFVTALWHSRRLKVHDHILWHWLGRIRNCLRNNWCLRHIILTFSYLYTCFLLKIYYSK